MLIHRNIKILFCLLSLTLVNPAHAVLTKYTDEATYLTDLAAASYDTAHESFEAGAWTNVRAFTSAPSVMNQGMTWA
ncbi:MAG: hypothetical protein KZQ77_12020, partial [Candidatus Thiodiazotropha sp. (ex Notomyrtea botanica)]|nr:hypothetical protein [Candidatus Thiodiazotropha sp. (ex Notomyrtea botanica)]